MEEATTIPAPAGLTARHEPGWAYITVPVERGYDQELEYEDQGCWTAAHKWGSEFLVPTPAYQRMEFRARYTRSGRTGVWATGRVWQPARPGDPGIEVDGDQPAPPRPEGLNVDGIGGDRVRFSWQAPVEPVDGYRVSWRRSGQTHWSHEDLPGGAVVQQLQGLARYSDYEIALRALVGGVESEPYEFAVVTTARGDNEFGPASPYNATASIVTDTTAVIIWDQDDLRAVQYWQVGGIPGVPSGQAEDQEYTITGLEPATTYTAQVIARGWDQSYGAAAAQATFTTTGSGPKPPPKPPTGLRIVEKNTTARWVRVAWGTAKGHEDVFWRVVLDNVDTKPRTVRTPGTLFGNLQHGRTYGWRVRTVHVDGEGFEHESAWIQGPEFSLDEVPPAQDPPSPPANVRAHCIHPTHAKIEWDPGCEEVTRYTVTVDGVSKDVIGTLVEVGGLTPETTYTAQVRACRDQLCSKPAEVEFTTGADERPPDPDPPSGVPAPSGLYLDPVAAGKVRAFWDGAPGTWWLASIDTGAGPQTWRRVTSPSVELYVPPGQQQTFAVYAVVDGNPTKLSPITRAAVVTGKTGGY